MAAKSLPASAVGLPGFEVSKPGEGNVFDLSSHQRAREALRFGLSIDDPGFNIFVVGEDRSSRMTSTLDFLEASVADRPAPGDWLYLNNFQYPNRPKPYRVPAGVGRRFCARMADLVPQLREQLSETLSDRGHEAEIRAAGEKLESAVAQRMDGLRQEAEEAGLKLVQTREGTQIFALDPDGQPIAIDEAPAETWTVTDGDYRMRDLIKYIRAESARDEPTITRVTIGTTTSAEVGAFAGMERPMFFVDTGTERVEIPIYDGAAMAWRSVLASHTPAPADRFSVSLDRIRTLGKIPNALAVTLIMGAGDRGRGLVRVEGFGASVPVEGAFMPQHVADAGDAEPEDA